jgi:hypothetical protein
MIVALTLNREPGRFLGARNKVLAIMDADK